MGQKIGSKIGSNICAHLSRTALYINLSIGFDNILNINVKSVNSRLRGGEVQSLVVIAQAANIKKLDTSFNSQF